MQYVSQRRAMTPTAAVFVAAFLVSGLLVSWPASNTSASDDSPRSVEHTRLVVNGGFEDDFAGWIDTDPSAISGEAHSGAQSAKLEGPGARVEQTVPVRSGRDYILRAWVRGGGKVGVDAGKGTYRRGCRYDDFTRVSLRFNTGANTEVTIFGEFHEAEGRFDDFVLLPLYSPPMVPAEVLSLENWKVTIPFDADGNDGRGSGGAADIEQPDLSTYELPGYFEANPRNGSVVFTAHAAGATTGNSRYPRSELREMTDDGTTQASWSSSSGKHTLYIRQSLNALPFEKPEVVVGQIHDADDDVFTFRVEGRKLYITDGDGVLEPPIDADYELGSVFEVMFVVENDRTDFYYNGELVRTLELAFSEAYFKAGCYTQSNCYGPVFTRDELCCAHGEVEIFDLWVVHE